MTTITIAAIAVLTCGYIMLSILVWNHTSNQKNRLHEQEMKMRALDQRLRAVEASLRGNWKL